MKKRTSKFAIAAFGAALALAAVSCEPEKNARLIVRNELDIDIVALSLTGEESTGDLLDGKVIEDGESDFEVQIRVAPGTYQWHAASSNALAPPVDGSSEIELRPGPNHVVLSP
jgi:hypothetical protein